MHILDKPETFVMENLHKYSFYEPSIEEKRKWDVEFMAKLGKSRQKELEVALLDVHAKKELWKKMLSTCVLTPQPMVSGVIAVDDHCWMYSRQKVQQMNINNAVVLPHRIAWTLFFGFISTGMLRHTHPGGNGCFNPSHFKGLGTSKQNASDMYEQGSILLGNAHPQRKLQEDEVERFILAITNEGKPIEEASSELSWLQLSRTTLPSVRDGKNWRHVWIRLFSSGKIKKESVPKLVWEKEHDIKQTSAQTSVISSKRVEYHKI